MTPAVKAPSDLTGWRFGLLVVSEGVGRASNGQSLWRCVCRCGGDVVVVRSSLVAGKTRSCGCLYGATRRKAGTAGVASGGRRVFGSRLAGRND